MDNISERINKPKDNSTTVKLKRNSNLLFQLELQQEELLKTYRETRDANTLRRVLLESLIDNAENGGGNDDNTDSTQVECLRLAR